MSAENKIKPSEKRFRFVLWALLELFAAGSLFYTLRNPQLTNILLCVVTLLLLSLPYAVIKIFKCEMNTVFFTFCLFYAIGPLLGDVYNLYYLTTWWDDVLHTFGGIAFAVLGVFFAELINRKGHTTVLMKAVFALAFSMAISVFWEFYEYGSDILFHTDMQQDTVVTSINSYLLGDTVGIAGTITDIEQTVVNGNPIGVNGYLDIGLHDTMTDMLLETLGAVVFSVIYYLDKERHLLIYRVKTLSASPHKA